MPLAGDELACADGMMKRGREAACDLWDRFKWRSNLSEGAQVASTEARPWYDCINNIH